MPVFKIPVQSAQAQSFSIQLAGIVYNMTLKWNTQNGSWVLDIYDQSNDLIIGGIPLITGADLLEQYAYLGLGGSLVAQTDNDVGIVPTFESLGAAANLYFVTSS